MLLEIRVMTFCKLARITRAPCRNRLEVNGDLGHKVLSEGIESGLRHRYAVVVQDIVLVGSKVTQRKMRSERCHVCHKSCRQIPNPGN